MVLATNLESQTTKIGVNICPINPFCLAPGYSMTIHKTVALENPCLFKISRKSSPSGKLFTEFGR